MEARPSTALLRMVDAGAPRAGRDVLHAIFESSHDGILVIDPAADRVLEANPRVCALLGHSRDELLSTSISALHPADLPRLLRFAQVGIESGEGTTGELPCRRRDGSFVPVEVSSARTRVGGRPCLVCVVRDVSGRKRAEEEARRAHDRLRRGLAAAGRIQASLLPHALPPIPGVRVAWIFRPCEELAGDNLNVFPLDEHHVGAYVLDVSGHGVAAALLAVAVQRFLAVAPGPDSLVRRTGPHGTVPERPARVAERLNRRIRPHLQPSQYLTLLYGVLDRRTRELRFASAGHWGPVLVPRGASAQLLHARGFPIGVMESAVYEEHTVRLADGDRLYLYSDGIPEAADTQGELFDYPRITASLEESRERSLEESVSRLVQRVQAWHGGAQLEDDVSVLALEMDAAAIRPAAARAGRRAKTSIPSA